MDILDNSLPLLQEMNAEALCPEHIQSSLLFCIANILIM